jgi:uncharacterized membrane protein
VRLDRTRAALAAIGLAVLVVLIGAPLMGWPHVVRLPAVVVPALLLAGLAVPRTWWRESPVLREDWQPSRRLVWSAAALVGVLVFWYVLTRFRSGEINAIDFTVYYDRPCYQTTQGRPLFVETSDTPTLSNRSELADHAYWGMLVACAPYAIVPSPLWLHALSAIAVVAGGVHVMRIAQRLGAGGLLAGATALALVLNDNTARTLNYGFHPEVLYVWFVPWMIDAALADRRMSFLAATLACVLVKEDACLPLFAAAVALALNGLRTMTWKSRWLYLALPTGLALANLSFFYAYVVPTLSGQTRPTYSHFWGNYGATPMWALVGMITHPWSVLKNTLTSGVFRTLQPHLFLPLIGWQWAIGTVPIVLLYGASANEQVRAFGIYYASVLVPFFVLSGTVGALRLARRLATSGDRAQQWAAAAVLLGPLLIGSGHRGYSLRPWKTEVAAVPQALAQLADEPKILVQSGLLPHAGYDARLQLLTPETIDDPCNAGAVILLAHRLGAYPFHGSAVAWFSRLPAVEALPDGLIAVRLTPDVKSEPARLRPANERPGRWRCRPVASRRGRHRPSWRRADCSRDDARALSVSGAARFARRSPPP